MTGKPIYSMVGLLPLAEDENRHGIDIHVSLFKGVHPTTTDVFRIHSLIVSHLPLTYNREGV